MLAFRTNMNTLDRAYMANEFKEHEIVNSVFENTTFKELSLENAAVSAALFFTERGWPDDFMLSYGNFTHAGCSPAQFGFTLTPGNCLCSFQ